VAVWLLDDHIWDGGLHSTRKTTSAGQNWDRFFNCRNLGDFFFDKSKYHIQPSARSKFQSLNAGMIQPNSIQGLQQDPTPAANVAAAHP